jgi:hypothetical protein
MCIIKQSESGKVAGNVYRVIKILNVFPYFNMTSSIIYCELVYFFFSFPSIRKRFYVLPCQSAVKANRRCIFFTLFAELWLFKNQNI